MTREQIVRISLEQQLHASTGWTVLDEPLAVRAAPSDMPGFNVMLGITSYDSYNAAEQPLTGKQSVTIRIYYAHAQNILSIVFADRSTLVNFIEEFFRGGYTPPAAVPGDTAQIDWVRIDSIEAESESRLQSRSLITVRCTSSFTLI